MFEDILGRDKIELSRLQKTIIFVINTLNELSDKGLLKGKAFKLSEDALGLIEGFKPTDDEIILVLGMLKEKGYIHTEV